MKYNVSAFKMIATDLMTVAKKVSDHLEQNGVSHAIIGGLAVGAYSPPRTTQDVDFMVPNSALNTIQELGDTSPLSMWAGYEGVSVNVDGIDIDFVFLGGLPESILTDGPKIQGVHVISPEGLILMKLHAGRAKDVADVTEILKAEKVDVDKIKDFLGEHDSMLLEDFESAKMMADYESGKLVASGPRSKPVMMSIIARRIARNS